MNTLMNIEIKMTSLDVSELTGKRHDNVMADIRKEIKELGEEIGLLIFQESSYINSQNKKQPCYSFGRKGAMQLALKYDPVTRYKVIQKIEELENNSKPKSQLEILQLSINQLVEQEKRLSHVETRLVETEKRQENISEIVALNPNDWRKDTTKILNSIAKKTGGYEQYRNIRNESYELLENRASANLSIRVTNKKKKMAFEGMATSKIDKVSKLDVIGEDKRLLEIFLAIVKEMAIKYDVELESGLL